MAKYLTDRQDRKLEEMARKLDGLSLRKNRLPSPSSQITGTDFGSVIVPREIIPAATRTVQAGSDLFTPGEGTAYLFKRATGGEIEPRLDRDGAVIFRAVYNLSTQSYAPNNAAPTTDYIGPETVILFALMDRSAKLYIPADAEAMTGSAVKMARNQGSPIAAFDEVTDTPGTGTVDVWEFDNGTVSDTAVNLTVYNYYSYPVPASERIVIRQEAGDDRWIVDMDGQHTIEGFSAGSDGTETLFPYDKLIFQGDLDQSATLGNIIDITVSKAATTVTVDINATGDMFAFTDVQSPTPGTTNVALGDTITLATAIDETMTTQFLEWRVTADTLTVYAGKVFDVTGDTGDVDIFPLETFNIVGAGGTSVAVSKAVNTVTATITGAVGLPVGAIVQSWLQPIVDTGKKYIDRDGAADTDWALMDGASNSSPGSAIDMQDFFVRGASDDLNDADNTAAGRTVAASPDDDEVRIQVTVDAHVDHIHSFDTDACHDDVTPAQTHFDFSTSATKRTSIQQKATSSIGDPLTLSHTVITTLTNNQGGTSPAGEHIEMTPPHKKLHWFERVA